MLVVYNIKNDDITWALIKKFSNINLTLFEYVNAEWFQWEIRMQYTDLADPLFFEPALFATQKKKCCKQIIVNSLKYSSTNLWQ